MEPLNNQIDDPFVQKYRDFKLNNEEHMDAAVRDAMKRLPPFDWSLTPYNDGVQRIIKGVKVNKTKGAKYEGEWI